MASPKRRDKARTGPQHLDQKPEAELTDEERAFKDRWDKEFGPEGNLSVTQRRMIGVIMIVVFVGVIVMALMSV